MSPIADSSRVFEASEEELQHVRGGSQYYGSRGRGVHRAMKPDRVTRNQSTPTQSHHSMSPIADSSRVFKASEEVQGGSQYYGSRGRGVHRATKPDRVTRNQSTPTQSHHSMSPIADSSRVFEASEEVRGGSQYYGSRGRGVHRATKPDRVTRNQSTPTQSHHSMSPIADSSRVFEASEEVRGGSQYYGSRGRGVHRVTKPDRVTRNQSITTQSHHSMSPIADSSRVFEASEEDRYQYEDNVDSETTRLVWEERAKLRFSGLWVLVRKHCKKKTGSTNPAHWRLVCPEFVNEEDWDGILASWMTEKWKKRSAAGIANRKKVPGDEDGSYVRHTGGYVSFEIHRKCWETQLGIEMTDIEFFEKLHKKDKDWDGILASWMTEKWRKCSAAGVANRKKVPGDEEGLYLRHTGGCVSLKYTVHAGYETELGIEMTDIEFFEKLHKKDKGKGTWCDLRAERAAAKYREIVMKKNGADDLVIFHLTRSMG
ncbi:GRAS protein [Tanacetum coccineum]